VSFGRNDVEVVEWFGLNEVVVGCVVVVEFCDVEVIQSRQGRYTRRCRDSSTAGNFLE
jgi:hypothetical protein